MPVRELLARVGADELTEWHAYEQETGPLDAGHRADVHAGIIAATIANVNRGKKGRRYKPGDFVPNWSPKPAATSWEDQLRAVEQMNRALGGRDLRPDRGGPT
ncbi:MAG: hypothetical protein L0206_01180 [Actinobacteria bacterium]|nr:hypothetical protein [Actinomycetota bacterium]